MRRSRIYKFSQVKDRPVQKAHDRFTVVQALCIRPPVTSTNWRLIVLFESQSEIPSEMEYSAGVCFPKATKAIHGWSKYFLLDKCVTSLATLKYFFRIIFTSFYYKQIIHLF